MMPDVFKMANQFANDIREAAIYSALAFNAIHGLHDDEISENKALKKYGKEWIKDRTDRNLLHFARTGSFEHSTKVYSVFEIETLKRAEKFISDIYKSAIAKSNDTTSKSTKGKWNLW